MIMRPRIAAAVVMLHVLSAQVSFGNHDIHLVFDWKDVYYNYEDIKTNLKCIDINRHNIGNSDILTPESINYNSQQNSIFSFLNCQLTNYDEHLGRLTIIQGKAGTGKSCLINEIVYDINSYFNCSCILLTGVAANNINGATSLILNNNIKATPFCLRIPVLRSYVMELSNETKIILNEISNSLLLMSLACYLN